MNFVKLYKFYKEKYNLFYKNQVILRYSIAFSSFVIKFFVDLNNELMVKCLCSIWKEKKE